MTTLHVNDGLMKGVIILEGILESLFKGRSSMRYIECNFRP